MFLVRLVVGLLKGVLVGAAVGYGLVAAGMATPPAAVIYVAAGVCGVLTAMIAGKPVWAKEARIEVMMKAVAGMLLGPAILFALRRFVQLPLPADLLAALPGLEATKGAELGLSTFSMTSLSIVSAILAGFFDADNQPAAESGDGAKQRIAEASSGRVASAGAQEQDLSEEHESQERMTR